MYNCLFDFKMESLVNNCLPPFSKNFFAALPGRRKKKKTTCMHVKNYLTCMVKKTSNYGRIDLQNFTANEDIKSLRTFYQSRNYEVF